MPEGLSATEVGKEIHEHAEHAAGHVEGAISRHGKLISIVEAVLLSIVTITAAWSGYAAAKWNTESSLNLAQASAFHTKANQAYLQSLTLRSQDASNFNAWFYAYLAGNEQGERTAEKRFRQQYDVAFRAWLATKPFTNPNAPKGPQYMPQYVPTGLAQSKTLSVQADAHASVGEHAASVSDRYIRVTVILASVLFLVGLSSHFPLAGVRWGLVGVGACLLIFAGVEILQPPGPPV
ncbi:MAG TPA: hypothetical protein VGH82_01760 [Gaiellaceae bacterium]|jgi:hypothetical protein